MEVKVVKQKSLRRKRDNSEAFVDFYLIWEYNSRAYAIRVKPSFPCDYDKLFAIAEEVPSGEMVEKYV